MKKIQIDEDAWIEIVSKCLEEDNFTREEVRSFSIGLFNGVALCRDISVLVAPDNKQVKDLRKHLEKLKISVGYLNKKKQTYNFYRLIEHYSTKFFEKRTGNKIDINTLSDFIEWMEFLTNALYKISSRPGRNNREAQLLCHMICKCYETYLKVQPPTYEGDFAADSGDHKDATPYERVCYAVGELVGVDVNWTTCHKVANTYKSEGFEIFQIVVDPGDGEQMKSMKKLFEI
jgi:hypothetical protein